MDNNILNNQQTNQQQNNQFHPIAGLWSGIGDMMSGNKYTPYMTANWAGNGLARTGIGYMLNPNYRDYVSAGQALGASNVKNPFTKDNMNRVLGRLSGMGGNIGNWANRMMGNTGNSFVRQNIDNYVYDRTQPTNNISDYINRYVNDIDYNDSTLGRAILDASYYNAIPEMRGL
jgi:hypothetical protein